MPPALASSATAQTGDGRLGEPPHRVPAELGIVKDDELAAGRAAHVELDSVGAQPEREPEGLGSVLGSRARRAAVRQHKRALHTLG